MKSITIKGYQRESVGKVATKALRNAGQIPCVIYGGDKPVHFSSQELAFRKLVYTPNVYTATIELENEKFTAVLQDIQFHPVTDKILHIDFYQLFGDKEISMNIPVKLIGNSKGVMVGGALHQNMRKLRIKALPSNLPDIIEADIAELEIGSKLVVSAIKNDNYTILHPENTVVAQVRMSRNASQDDIDDTGEAVEEVAAEQEATKE